MARPTIHVRIKREGPYLIITASLEPSAEDLESTDRHNRVSKWTLSGTNDAGREESLLEILSRDIAAELGTEDFELKLERVKADIERVKVERGYSRTGE